MPRKKKGDPGRTGEQIARELDRNLLRVLKQGRPAYDAAGQPVLDPDGKQLFKPPTAADLQAARQRLSDLGVKAAGEKNPVQEAFERMRAKDRGEVEASSPLPFRISGTGEEDADAGLA
ncbi:MAG: hypothetical protein ACLFV3_13040 [Phycisphaeraceae bacterium]